MPYRFYPDSSGDEPVLDENGRPIVLLEEKASPEGRLFWEEGSETFLPVVLVLLVLALLFLKKPK